MIRPILEKRKARRAFEKLVAPGGVESLLGDGIEQKSLTQTRIEFVLAFVRGDNPSQISERMGRVALKVRSRNE